MTANPETARPRACLHTLGCRLNQAETMLLEDQLRARGYEIVPFGESAELGIINTCTVTREADAKSRKLIRAFIRNNPGAFTAVIGCYSQMGYKALAEIKGVDLIVGNEEKLNVLDYVDAAKNVAPIVVRDRLSREDFVIDAAHGPGLTKRTNLKIQDGCDFMCSFCVIAFARGRVRSRVFENALDEARGAVAAGARELVLTGVNLGMYLHEGRGLSELIDALNAIDGLDRIRISSIEPTTIDRRILEMMADPNHCLVPYLHIPLQSGSDRILALMKRRYNRDEFLRFIDEARAAVPDLCIGTDVMVGFPGETDEDFAQTLELLRDGPIDYAHVFKYSERPGVASVHLPEKVDARTMNRRSVLARRIGETKRQRFYQAYVGRVVQVLFEERENDLWLGYTGNYVRVALRSQDDLKNRIFPVRIDAISGDVATSELIEGLKT